MDPVPDEPGKLQGLWQNLDIDGRYEVSFTVRDQDNVKSTSSPEIFRKVETRYALSLRVSSESEFSYSWYLDNFESDFNAWSDSTSLSKSVEYQNLTPGDYRFHVRAKSSANQVSNEAVSSFSVVDNYEPKKITSLEITPSTATIKENESVKLTATATYSDSTEQDVSSSCTWQSQIPSIGAVDSVGTTLGVSIGTTVITASYSGFEASASIIITKTSPGESFTNSLGMTFMPIQPGTFMMGSPSDELGRYSDEGPQHQVTLSTCYYMQSTEVTQGQWKAVMKTNPSAFSNCGDNCPVEVVFWNDIQIFIDFK